MILDCPPVLAVSDALPLIPLSDGILFGLGLVPFAGIAFLWFIGVVRDLIGDAEDRFFATVFLGSGILFVAIVFVLVNLVVDISYAIINPRIRVS